MKNEIINENLSESIGTISHNDIYFISIAESGAMGDGGGISICSIENNRIVHRYGNYYYGDLNFDDVMKAIPSLKGLDLNNSCDFGEWHHEYMEAGNHLLINDKIFNSYKSRLNDIQSSMGIKDKILSKLMPKPMFIYSNHQNIIMAVLQDLISL